MFSFIYKNFPNVCMFCVIIGTAFVATFQLVSVNATRDRKSDDIRRIEKDCAALEKEIESLQAQKATLCNTQTLSWNRALRGGFKEPEKIIRVRTMCIPYASGRVQPAPKALAVDLCELASARASRQ